MDSESSMHEEQRLYAVLNLSKSATDAEIHERHRSLSLLFHPDKHRDDSKSLATERFLEIQKAYEGWLFYKSTEQKTDRPLRAVYDSLGEPGISVNWLEETRTKSTEEASISDASHQLLLKLDLQLQQIFNQIRRDWLQKKADTVISPRGRVVCKVDASSLFIPYQGLQEDAWPRRLLNRLEDVRLLSFSLRHDMQKRITESSVVSLAARISRRGLSGRGNFIGTLRHQYSPRLAFEVAISIRSHNASNPISKESDTDYSESVSATSWKNSTWSFGFILNSFNPKLVGEWGLRFTELPLQCKLGLECGLDGLAWLFSGAWKWDDAGALQATIRLNYKGVVLIIEFACLYLQKFSVPVLLSEHYDSGIALWAATVSSTLCVVGYHLIVKPRRRKQRLRAIRSALRALETNSSYRNDAEAVISFLKDKARDCMKVEAAKGGLVIVDATYGAMETADRDLGLSWDVTIPVQALVRGSQVHISARHPKSSIQGFLDPAPFTLKSLRVRYLFRGRMHFTEVPDHLPLILPLAEKTPTVPQSYGILMATALHMLYEISSSFYVLA
ncbi:hypothetical protein B0H10DRAFT_1938666 [Mycena sp. CBHHK59/15]|nr:hypothetical protein B0H10DRAFT_1938666 [Mycena sp. CBHHK59/15]